MATSGNGPCSICRDLCVTEKSNQGQSLSLHITIDALKSNCRYCTLLLEAVASFAPECLGPGSSSFIFLDLESGRPACIEVCDRVHDDDDDDDDGDMGGKTLAQFYLYLSEPCPQLPWVACLNVYSRRSDSEECFDFIERQLKTCLDGHANCERTHDTPLPRRVLSIGSNMSDGVRLLEGVPDVVESGHEYATLSYCWGQVHPIKTTMNTLDAMKQCIDWQSLPIVFQDAIRVCWRLHIKYLWIDSLCIIQDSEEDWETESAQMSQYYQAAYINISAAASPNSTLPFLCERAAKWQPRQFDLGLDDGTSIQMMARQHSGSSTTQLLEDSGPLATRGWIYQETILSTRVLHFTEAGLIWECRSDVCCEDGAVPRGLYSLRLTQLLARLSQQTNRFNLWHEVVSGYSTRELSYETDRMPAISGVASRMQSLLQASYVAGMWKQNLIVDLCWSVDAEASRSSEFSFVASQYIAPSWAWPSVKESVVFADEDAGSPFLPLATVIDVDCTVPGLNPFGKISRGHLTLHGPMTFLPVHIHDPKNRYTYTIGSNPDETEPFAADCALVEVDGGLRRAKLDDRPTALSLSVPCMLLGKFEHDDELFLYVLVLGKLSDNTFCRVGLAVLDHASWFDAAQEQKIRIE